MANNDDIASVTMTVYNLLKPLESEDRQRVVAAAQTLLGDAVIPLTPSNLGMDADAAFYGGDFSPKVRIWLQKNALSNDILSQVFHIEGGNAEIIAGDVPGKSGREKSINAYILTGAREYILRGDAKFDDKTARETCRLLGCYNETNHATYIKDKGNLIGGSKSTGWTLTGPGLKAAADIIKGIYADHSA